MPALIDRLLDRIERPKNVADCIAKLVIGLNHLEAPASNESQDKALHVITRHLGFLKGYLIGDDEHEVTKESVLEVAKEVARTDMLFLLVKHLAQLEFEPRKDAALIFGASIRVKDADDKSVGSVYILQHPIITRRLFYGYDDPTIALNCGGMLRDCLRDEAVAKQFLENSMFLEFFDRVEVANFEVASDAFSTFKDLLTRHKTVVAQYLQENYADFFAGYMRLLKSDNYVTRRQSLKLLGELLLDRSNVKVMVRFVSDVQHLMQMMLLLKDSSRSIQFEAFHVFKVFVANPSKPQPIIDILTNNKEKLLKYLEDFHTDRDDSDEMFKEEKAVLIREISSLGQRQNGEGSSMGTGASNPPLPDIPPASAS
mmetsp:Transcript_19074/g.32684  ORF Transcript_19074/g.32684 Transcript_19074/m.32684 type:complete len:370 (-) Transcript_19074:403-1512(-)|eukprot:CAMPEP_0119108930 /NCGR_PEP_ID=MMETSP1180-20130426/16226_1 /TAXON_ID=3052 ORGANISM="Chlamydomonas cf sp, Strain CCMP681" /NCGR_SAMPLE_ID=MMETSP1180 /ASSEMBLY_ACC=CAM_ASM_000741 /LENGTH=369 /DNA_ID=CAMNT_0007094609 /DNA_START=81 /DNA_END=1190 /DNA_ORIENTATION=+